ncbi:MAG: protein-methionine-sulfoxide reductase heme-binding subunit MsrQ [Marinosulfonomonas sp.]|nr:MAG: protein-methionine-sulfoxide reductase heme-binding subunit MsrQ [Marinosulfonomonas sp.]
MAIVDLLNGALRRIPTWVLYIGGIMPAIWLLVLLLNGGLGVDPVKVLEHRAGKIGLQFLIAGLVVTPLCRITGLKLIKFRRAIGLLTFFYIALHLMIWLALDIQFYWGEIWTDILKRPYITIGMIGFLAMLPLALTSNNASIKRIGVVGWRKLHKLTYLAAIAGALHYVWLVKGWQVEPLIYMGGVVLLLAMRIRVKRRRVARI